MAHRPTISQQKVLAASQGNAALLEVLQQIAQTTVQTQVVVGLASPSGRIGPGAASPTTGHPAAKTATVPPQATGIVSMLGTSYIVELINPGGITAPSPLQAAQIAGRADALTNLRPVTRTYHQIRASTSPAFNVNSNTQVFGGNTGSTQTFWTLTGLGSGTWFFQFRSSFDGVSFNTWKNANSGTGLGGLISQVTVENVGVSKWAVFSMPGSLTMAIGSALLADQSIFSLAPQVYSSGMFALAGPNGFQPNGNAVYGATLCDVQLQLPIGGTLWTIGVPDYPAEIRMQYGSSGYLSPGIASVFAIAFDPSNKNVTMYPGPFGVNWAVLQLPGGAKIAIGQGRDVDGATIWTPPAVTWIDPTRMISICSLTDATNTGQIVTGYNKCQLSGLTVQAQYLNPTGGNWSTTANWLAIAWQQGSDILMGGGFPFIDIELQGGHAVIIGAGQGPSGTPVVFPAGFVTPDFVAIATPAGTEASTHHLRGIQQCGFIGTVPFLTYSDDASTWSGPVNWMAAVWR